MKHKISHLKITMLLLTVLIYAQAYSQSRQIPKVDHGLYTKEKKLRIYTEIGEKMELSKEKYNLIIDKFPELYQFPPLSPETTYRNSPLFNDSSYWNDDRLRFYNSEQGQDVYFILYAWFLKKKNGQQKFVKERKTLSDIFYHINYIKCFFSKGGTYYIHLYRTMMAEIEYRIFQISRSDSSFLESTDFQAEKDTLIKSLKKKLFNSTDKDIDSLEKELYTDQTLNLQSILKEIKGEKKDVDEYVRKRITYNYVNVDAGIELDLETDLKLDIYSKKEIISKINALNELISNTYYFKWSKLLDKQIF
jgi:hypothetical protein